VVGVSLGVALRGPEGVVLAADSRVTLTAITGTGQIIPATFDNATKLLKVKGQDYLAAVTYGQGALGATEPRTAHSFLPEFEDELGGADRLSVLDFATKMGEFYKTRWDKAGMPPGADPMLFLVGGFDDGAVYGRVYEFAVPTALTPKEWPDFGVVWGGQGETATRLLNGYDPSLWGLVQKELGLDDAATADLKAKVSPELGMGIPYQFLPLQDCIDLAILLVCSTARLQNFFVGIRGVGGAIDVATITRTDGFQEIQRKRIGGQR
jgi:hypothetical protein